MKKLFALICTMAMVMSLFAGVVVADNELEATVNLSATTLIVGEDYYHITGSIIVDGARPAGEIIDYTLTVEGDKTITGQTASGNIDLLIAAADIKANTEYTLSFTENNVNYTIPDQKIVTRYNLVLDQNLSNLAYGQTNLVVSGKLVDSKNNPVVGATVGFTGANHATPVTTASNGSFAVLLTSITAAGEDALQAMVTLKDEVTAVEYKSFDVAAKAFSTLTVTPATTVHTAVPTNLVFTAKAKDVAGEEQAVTDATYTITGVSIYADSVTAGALASTGSEKDSTEQYYTKLVLTKNTSVKFASAGVATITATNGQYAGTTTIEVSAPSKVNVIGLATELTTIGSQNLTATLYNIDGTKPAAVEVTAKGPGFDALAANAVTYTDGALTVAVTPNQAGTIELVITTKDANGATIDSVSRTVAVKGYAVTVSTAQVLVGSENDITVIVSDVNGNPVNNAVVTLGGIVLDGRYTTITNGVYTFAKAKWNAVGAQTLLVEVYTDSTTKTTKAQFAKAVTVLGEEVYTVTVDKSAVMAGKASELVINVTDAEGKLVNGTVDITVDDTNTVSATRQTDGSYKATVTAVKSIEVLAHTSAKTKIGKAAVEVKAPVVTANVSALTDGFTTNVSLTITDPFTGEALAATLKPIVENATVVYTDGSGNTYSRFGVKATEFSFTTLATDTRTTAQKDAGKASAVKFNVILNQEIPVEFTLPVKAAAVTVTPDTLFIDTSNSITVTALDANGAPLVDKVVKYGETVLGNTNDEGKLSYAFRPLTAGTVSFTVARADAGVYTAKATVGADTEAPVITLDPIAPVVNTATIKVSGKVADNLKVGRVYVNDSEVLVIPGQETTFSAKVTLDAGKNVITVFAFDASGNAAKVEQEVTYQLPTVIKLTVGSTMANVNGATAALDVAPYVKAGRTMVPFRFLSEQLGAYVEWNEAAQSVTYLLGEDTIVLTIGSTVAMVNDVAKTLDVAPEVTSGRTMVPLRFVLENFGAYVEWNEAAQSVTVIK